MLTKCRCVNLISWKHSFEKIGKDLELARKKKQALDDLFNSGKISQNTYDSINNEITSAITEIEARQKDLAEKMSSKITEFEGQINTLEVFLANSELQYAAGEIDDQLHERESGAFNLALEATKQQLNAIKEVVGAIMPEVVPEIAHEPSETVETPPAEVVAEPEIEMPVETPLEETPTEETLSETSLEPESTLEEAETEPLEELPTETPTEETTEVLPETPTEEAFTEESVEALPETPMETEPSITEGETVEEIIEETEVTPEAPTETAIEEPPTEEEIEVPVRDESFFPAEEEDTEE